MTHAKTPVSQNADLTPALETLMAEGHSREMSIKLLDSIETSFDQWFTRNREVLAAHYKSLMGRNGTSCELRTWALAYRDSLKQKIVSHDIVLVPEVSAERMHQAIDIFIGTNETDPEDLAHTLASFLSIRKSVAHALAQRTLAVMNAVSDYSSIEELAVLDHTLVPHAVAGAAIAPLEECQVRPEFDASDLRQAMSKFMN